MNTTNFRFLIFCFLALLLAGCQPKNPSNEGPLFQLIDPADSGIDFANAITENDSMNVADFVYIYNGGGVAVGDLNSDGLQDLYFSGNMVSGKLYLNKGNLQFEDITEPAGTATHQWTTGVSMIDLNQDGRLDIYLCAADHFHPEQGQNLLFINQGNDAQGIPRFKEMAAEYGLNDAGYSTQAAFFDYDLDGDLDMYLLTNGTEIFSQNTVRPKKMNGQGLTTDRLYRNNGLQNGAHPTFTNVSEEANILIEGYGLGVAINDLNLDGWPDVYCANDFISNDLVWINQGVKDGVHQGFQNMAAAYLSHQSHNGMGVDIADFNNDAKVDIMVLDMLPEDNYRKKTMLGKPNYDYREMARGMGYQDQYVRNTLQLNQGLSPNGHMVFSDVGPLAGIHQTDWSWSCLFADYDNDGLRDLYITNGYRKDITDLDFVHYEKDPGMFGTTGSKEASAKASVANVPEVEISNYMYRNTGNLNFEEVTNNWGLERPSYSNGAAFADLDNDGDLEIVVNNIDAPAFLYKNMAQEKASQQDFLQLTLVGSPGNRSGIGAKIYCHLGDTLLYHYQSLSRGYKSSVSPTVHFGLGSHSKVDSLTIVWPNGSTQTLRNVEANQNITLTQQAATVNNKAVNTDSALKKQLFSKANEAMDLDFVSEDEDYVDFKIQPLVPHKHSQLGPSLAVGDVNGDGLQDFFTGGNKGHYAHFFLQKEDGTFEEQPLEEANERYEDRGAVLFDADADGDLDLYIASGSSEFYPDSENYQDRFFRNDGKGHFTYEEAAIPQIRTSTSAVKAADFDQDGDLDLFVGGRLRPFQYPLPPKSFLLRNDGGTFSDITSTAAPMLQSLGMVSDALWTDFNNDLSVDLVLVGEFMHPTFLQNQNGVFIDVSEKTGLTGFTGWSTSLTASDFDQDGDLDYVAGNLGLNNIYQTSSQFPLSIYAKDYDKSGNIDPVMSYYIQGPTGKREKFVAHPRDLLIDQMSKFRNIFPRYTNYAAANFEKVIPKSELEGAHVFHCTHLANSYFENLGNGEFRLANLPLPMQFAPVFGMLAKDFNADGFTDLLSVGNFYSSDVHTGDYDAYNGLLALGDGKGNFSPIPIEESGFYVPGDAKALVEIASDKGHYLLASNNGGPIEVFRWETKCQVLPLQPTDFSVQLFFEDGHTERRECYYGHSFLSQSNRVLYLAPNVQKVTITEFDGTARTLTFPTDHKEITLVP